ncbi:response regulator [Kineosporia succinea]|uniref:DNA-binding NarL/FixJ family response regulator n=1 Tax=Kineosporia succinea TaxID=84632 RepID=A0ABT9P1Y4_9ACTN|nr:response regulator transcription factor [Kineosporia succinea]MDP9826687.1 DNA-binding NarL/FixJ family response regulator [Kineosporia succinea]
MTDVPPYRVLLVDDHALVRAGLSALLDAHPQIQVVGEASDGSQVVELALNSDPDVVLMDLSMPGTDGVTATRELLSLRPQTQVLVLTSFSDRDRVRDALAAGAIGYLLKDSDPQDVVAGVIAAARRGSPLDPRVARTLLTEGTVGPPPPLSPRERDVLRLVAKGMANKQIGRALGISERTVKVHLGNVFRRIGVQDRTSAALWAKENLPDT